MQILYLTVEQVFAIHAAVLDPGEPREARDLGAIEAAVALPQATMFGEDLYRDPVTKAAALLRSLSQNHGFEQGNKRTAWISMRLFLATNGFEVKASSHEVLELMTSIATHDTSMEGIVEFMLDHITAYPDEHLSDEAL